MSDPSAPLSSPSDKLSKPLKPAPKQRPGRVRHIIIPLITLLLGVVIGIAALFIYGLSGDGQVLPAPGPGRTDISVVADKAFLTSLMTSRLSESGLPATVENGQVA